jgi:hypothetical protein
VRIRDELLEAARDLGIALGMLPETEAQRIRADVSTRFGNGRHPFDLWQTFGACAGVQDPEGWRWICERIGNHPLILFFDDDDETAIFDVPSGQALTDLLWSSRLFEFYVTDAACTFALCHNRYEFIIACGEAANWLKDHPLSGG